ncbi:MAG: HAD family phosphatase [Oscillospiraceae bacterium]|nr:HAD family phosphatase [Oscillospiraceae bacterium]
MEYKIIASDLDGTLLGTDKQVSRENWEAIAKIHEKGVHFVPASGRAFYEMPKELRESDLIRYYITSDGTMVYDKKTDTYWEFAMEKNLGHRVLDTVYKYTTTMMLHADTHSYVEPALHKEETCLHYNIRDWWVDYIRATNVPVENFKKFAYGLDKIQMICVFFRYPEELQKCKKELASDPRLLVAQSDPNDLEIFSSAGGKGNALKLLAEKLGIAREATMALGDSTNDATMVAAAGLGVAMDNAMPELKRIADTVICDNDHHAVQYVLNKYF